MQLPYDDSSEASVLSYGKLLEGKTLSGVLTEVKEYSTANKGDFGGAVEESYFRIPNNSRSGPDIEKSGIEIKSTGLKQLVKSKEFVAKERLVISTLNFGKMIGTTIYESALFGKFKKVLFIFYIYDKLKKYPDYKIDLVSLWSVPAVDIPVIENDWKILVKYVEDGRAHEITSGATKYIEACRGGGKHTALVAQPRSETRARMRRLALKNSYLTGVYRQLKEGHSVFRSEWSELEKAVADKISPYLGMYEDQISTVLGYQSKAKDRCSRYVRKMLGILPGGSLPLEFEKSGTILKTIRVNSKGKLHENISFAQVSLDELINQSWIPDDESGGDYVTFRDTVQSRFLFVIFEDNKDGKGARLLGAKLWTIGANDLDGQCEKDWNYASEAIKSSNLKALCKGTGHIIFLNTKGTKGHSNSSKKSDADTLPNGQEITRLAFWLSGNYIREQLSHVDWLIHAGLAR
ncbi:MAG TPA: MutH/Sau3AI family endonuclease [Candidatus Paceibacterota bacterium]|nr:MutH/Sau3AI family endonuclease [Candidatus Paceibacterota bacterium]